MKSNIFRRLLSLLLVLISLVSVAAVGFTSFSAAQSDADSSGTDSNVSSTPVPEWLAGVVPYDTIDTTQTISTGNTGFVITGGDKTSQFQIMPGGDGCSFNLNLPRNWDTLVAREGYRPIDNYKLAQ